MGNQLTLPILDPAPVSARRTKVRPTATTPTAAASGVHAVTPVADDAPLGAPWGTGHWRDVAMHTWNETIPSPLRAADQDHDQRATSRGRRYRHPTRWRRDPEPTHAATHGAGVLEFVHAYLTLNDLAGARLVLREANDILAAGRPPRRRRRSRPGVPGTTRLDCQPMTWTPPAGGIVGMGRAGAAGAGVS